METIQKAARRAGLAYLGLVLLGPFSLMYVPSKLIVPGDAAATAAKIHAAERLFRAGVVAGLAGEVVFLFVALLLYRLFKDVDRWNAVAMATLAIVSVPIGFLLRLNQLAALVLLGGGEFLDVFAQPQREALAMLFLRLYGQGILMVEVFWGLWLLPFGILVWRSGFLPRFLGALLWIAGLGYALGSLSTILFPEHKAAIGQVMTVTNFGELPIIFYLAFWGAQRARRNEPLAALAS